MQLHGGVLFIIPSTSTTWELRNQNARGNWVCRRIQPLCNSHSCPLQTFAEYTEAEIRQHVVLDPLDETKWLGLIEVEILTLIEARTKKLTSHQKRSLLLAIRDDLDQRASILTTLPGK